MTKRYAHVFVVTETSEPYWSYLHQKYPFRVLTNLGFFLIVVCLKSAHLKGYLRKPGTYRIDVRGLDYVLTRM